MQTIHDDRERLGRLFHALSDETRLRILDLLVRGECCVCDLQTGLDAYQSRLSFHLRRLKDAGLVSDRREGRWVYYAIEPAAIRRMTEFLNQLESEVSAGTGEECC